MTLLLTGQTAEGEVGLPPQSKWWQEEKYSFYTTIKNSKWPDPSLLFQFPILQIFWSTFHSLLQLLLHFSSADCFMEPSSFDPLEICPARCWSQLEHNLQKKNINQVVNLWFSCKPYRGEWATGSVTSSILLTSSLRPFSLENYTGKSLDNLGFRRGSWAGEYLF